MALIAGTSSAVIASAQATNAQVDLSEVSRVQGAAV